MEFKDYKEHEYYKVFMYGCTLISQKIPSKGMIEIRDEQDWAIIQTILFMMKIPWNGDGGNLRYFDYKEVCYDGIPISIQWENTLKHKEITYRSEESVLSDKDYTVVVWKDLVKDDPGFMGYRTGLLYGI